jgi:ribosome-binding protein aMBF1 (putative translation factor)
MSQGELAAAIGDYDRSSVANLEAGRVTPSLAVAQKLEDIFKVSIRVLLTEDPDPPRQGVPGGRPRKPKEPTVV